MGSFRSWYYLVQIAFLGFLGIFFLFAVPLAHSAPVTYETTRVGPSSFAPSGVTTPVTVKVQAPGVSKFHQIVPAATPSTIGKFARKIVRGGGVGVAVYGIVEGLGYLIDQASGQIQKVETVPVPGGNTVTAQVISNIGINASGKTEAQLQAYRDQYLTGTYNAEQLVGNTLSLASWNCPAGSAGISEFQQRFQCYTDLTYNDTVIDLDPSDYQVIDNALQNQLTLSQKSSIVSGALALAPPEGTVDSSNLPSVITTSNPKLQELYSDWPELKVALQQLVNAVATDYQATQDPGVTVPTEDQVIVDSGFNSPPPETPTDFELPLFCEWASFLCEPFIATSHPEVPTIDITAQDYDSGLPSSATCPEPYQIVTSMGTWTVTFQFACDLASAIRTPLIAMAYLMSAFIVVGVRR